MALGFLSKEKIMGMLSGNKIEEAPPVTEEEAASAFGVPVMKELGIEERKKLIIGIKNVLKRCNEKGFFSYEGKYGELIGDSALLYDFIKAYKNNKSEFEDIVLDKNGKPVKDEKTPLACGISLAQVCQMLVFTLARRQFNGAVSSAADHPKVMLMKPYIAFDWQLPLIKSYDYLLTEDHIRALQYDILELRAREDIEIIGSFPVSVIRKVKSITGDDFSELLRTNPEAINGVNLCDKELYEVIRKALRDRIWDFFSRDKIYLQSALSLDRKLITAFREALADADDDAFFRLRRLPIERSTILLKGCWEEFGPKVCVIFSDAEFINSLLKEIVEYLYQVEGDDKLFAETVRLKLQALKEVIGQWIE